MLNSEAAFSPQQGVGLIELLAAVVILSIGFLAAGTLQISSMRANQDSLQSAQALRLVGDMMDSMRNNPLGVSGGHYDDKSTGTVSLPACSSSSCSPADLAVFDLFTWSANFQDLRSVGANFLPVLLGADSANPAQGSISAPALDGSYTITVQWQGTENGQPATRTQAVRFQP